MSKSSIGNLLISLYENVIEPITDKLGIGVYNSLYRRFVVVTIGTGVALWNFKPIGLFDKDGNAREWAWSSHSSGATHIPWYFMSGLAGALSILFI